MYLKSQVVCLLGSFFLDIGIVDRLISGMENETVTFEDELSALLEKYEINTIAELIERLQRHLRESQYQKIMREGSRTDEPA